MRQRRKASTSSEQSADWPLPEQPEG